MGRRDSVVEFEHIGPVRALLVIAWSEVSEVSSWIGEVLAVSWAVALVGGRESRQVTAVRGLRSHQRRANWETELFGTIDPGWVDLLAVTRAARRCRPLVAAGLIARGGEYPTVLVGFSLYANVS